MALEIFLDSLEGVHESLHQHYVQQEDGKFILEVNASNGFELRNTQSIKKALETERTSASEHKRKLSAYGEITPDQATEAIRKVEELRGSVPEDQLKSMIEDEKKRLQSEYAKALDQSKSERDQYYNQFKREKLQTTALSAIEKHGGSVEVLLPHVLGALHFREGEDGNFLVEVKGSDGQTRVGQDMLTPMSVEELVVEYSKNESFAKNFEATGATGGGASGGGAGGRGGAGNPTEGMSAQEKLSYAHEHPNA